MLKSTIKSPTKSSSLFRSALAAAFLAAALCSVLISWSSTRTLSFSLGGTWHSASGEELVVVCEGGSAWSSACSLKSTHTQFDGVVRASPLDDCGWVAVLETGPSNALIVSHRGRVLTVVAELERGKSRRISYDRDNVRVEDLVSAMRMKGKYIAALFLVIGTYKWVQVSLFGVPARRLRRF